MTTAEWLALECTLWDAEDKVAKDAALLLSESAELRAVLEQAAELTRKFAAEAALREYEKAQRQ